MKTWYNFLLNKILNVILIQEILNKNDKNTPGRGIVVFFDKIYIYPVENEIVLRRPLIFQQYQNPIYLFNQLIVKINIGTIVERYCR